MEPLFQVQTQDAIIVAAILATLGWLYSARRARTLAKNQHTITIMLAGNFNESVRSAHKEVADYLSNEKPFPEPPSDQFRDLWPHLRLLLNYYEFIAAGVRRGDLNEQLVRNADLGSIVTLYELADPYIVNLRNKRGRPSLFEHLEWLNRRWERHPPTKAVRVIESCRGTPLQGRRAPTRSN